jgi:repressor LexA
LNTLTKKQKQFFIFIDEFVRKNGYAPTYREILSHFNLSSLGTVYKHLKILQEKGFLIKEKNCARTIDLNKDEVNKSLFESLIPLIGRIKFGMPFEMFKESKTFEVPKKFINNFDSTYALEVSGSGFIDENIIDGDILIVEASSKSIDHDFILGSINQTETVIKYFFQEDDFIRLESINPSFRPLFVRKDNLQIHGFILSIIRPIKNKNRNLCLN